MATRRRLDSELVRRGLARCRADAVARIRAGDVLVEGFPATKPDRRVEEGESISIARSDDDRWVSRGGVKLAGALADLPDLDVVGARTLDAGASTGGFTDVLLRRGADHVVAVDVGYGQMAWKLREDPRVTVIDRTNVRSLSIALLPYRPTLVVGDLSFISLRKALPALREVADRRADFLVLVKPQFEVGRALVGKGGVVRDPAVRAMAIRQVAAAAEEMGLGVRGLVASRLAGAAGNAEFFMWLRSDAPGLRDDDVITAIGGGLE